ncbi:hypothetical protein FQZ97_1171390 [compost metagenome]
MLLIWSTNPRLPLSNTPPSSTAIRRFWLSYMGAAEWIAMPRVSYSLSRGAAFSVGISCKAVRRRSCSSISASCPGEKISIEVCACPERAVSMTGQAVLSAKRSGPLPAIQ